MSGNWRWSSPLWTGVRQRLGTPAAGHALCLLAILGLAAACRFAALSTFPPGLNPDEAMNGNDALASLSSGHFEVFYPENYGREGLFIWLVALSLKLFGASIPALRYPSAVLGTLGVAAVYLLASELYGRRIAVLSGLLTAVSFWQLGFSRMSLRGILVPLFTSLAFGVLLRGLRKKSARSVLLAGALFGLGVYTYIAFRAAFLLLGLTLLLVPQGRWTATAGPRAQRVRGARWWPLAGFLAVIGVAVLPLLAVSLREPEAFGSRVRHVSVLASKDPGRALWTSAVLTGGMFFTRGDANPRHGYRKAPVLPPLVSPFFAVGLLLAVRDLAVPRARRPGQAAGLLEGRARAGFVLLWLAVMALPAVLTGRGVPHALRTIGMQPAVFILTAGGLAAAADTLGTAWRKASPVFLSAVIGLFAVGEMRTYFAKWGRDPLVREIFRQDLVEKVAYLRTRSAGTGAFLIANGRGRPVPYPDGLPMPAQTVLFLLYGDCPRPSPRFACPVFVRPEQLGRLAAEPSRPNVFMLLRDDDAREANQVSRLYPGGVWRALDDTRVYLWPR